MELLVCPPFGPAAVLIVCVACQSLDVREVVCQIEAVIPVYQELYLPLGQVRVFDLPHFRAWHVFLAVELPLGVVDGLP